MALASYGFSIDSRGLSAEQLAKLHAFKRLLQQSGAWDDARFDDHDCARFLKARQYDLQAAKQMWDNMLAWRKENRVDNIHDWFVFHERQEYDRVFPTGLHKTDKEGHPILIQQLGRVNIGALYKITNDDRIRLAHVAENEHLRRVVFPACSRSAGRPIDQLFTIIDLEGVAFTGMMRTTSLLKMFMAMDSNNYPETLSRMAIINAPGWFSTSWGAVKSVLSGDTVRKIEILGKDYKEALLRHIAPENLLVEYGGTSRGSVTANTGPWQDLSLLEPLPEPPAPPLIPPPLPLAGEPLGSSSNGGTDQRTPRDVHLRSQSPLRPGAKAPAGSGLHQAPPASPPAAKRSHLDATLQPQHPSLSPSLTATGQGSSSSPAPSVSDSSSDSAQNMAAPLLSNFLPASDSPLHQRPLSQPLLAAEGSPSSLPLPRGLQMTSSQPASTPAVGAARISTSAGGAPPATQAATSGAGGTLTPPAMPARSSYHTPLQHQQQVAASTVAARAVGGGGPAQLQLASPREDILSAETMMSASSTAYSMRSAFSPMSPMEPRAVDMATSRPLEPAAGPGLARASAGFAAAVTSVVRRISGGGGSGGGGGGLVPSGPSGSLGAPPVGPANVLFGSASNPSGELPIPGASSQVLQQQDTDDSESIRFSVMSQRSFYSALSHVDPSSSSGLTSPSEASDYARRWSVQRELHAAAIASALAATAEQRRIAAAAAAASLAAPAVSVSSKPVSGQISAPSAVPPLPGVSYIVPPTAQQAFGSYLDQPPSYRAVNAAESALNNSDTTPAGDDSDRRGVAGLDAAADGDGAAAVARGLKGSTSRGELAVFGSDVVIHVGSDIGGASGLSRSHSAAAMDECSLGAGAVRWARGWFFRRRNYGRLVDPESMDGAGAAVSLGGGRSGGSSAGGGTASAEGGRPPGATHGRKGSASGPYTSMKDGPGCTSPSKMLPKPPAATHHARGDSWEWDQPSPYDIDQTYGRAAGGGMMHREMSFGRGGERRRLLRSDSPGRKRGMLRSCCSCVPGCTVM